MILKKLQVIIVLFTLSAIVSANAQDNYFKENTGIQLYSLRHQFKKDVPSTLEKIKSLGITVLEGGIDTYGLSNKKFLAALKANGLKVVSLDSSFEDIRDKPDEVIKKAKTFGATYVMCAWIPHKGDDFTISDTQKAVKAFNSSGKLMKEQGITLVYHPHGYEFRPYEKGTLFDYMAKNAENFDFEMDVYWVVHGGEDPMELFERYPDKFKLMHLKDMKKGTKGNNTGHGDVEDNVVLGTGMINIKALAVKGKELGVEYMFIEDESSRVVRQLPESLKYLSAFLK